MRKMIIIGSLLVGIAIGCVVATVAPATVLKNSNAEAKTRGEPAACVCNPADLFRKPIAHCICGNLECVTVVHSAGVDVSCK